MVLLLGGVLIAAFVFAATLFSAAQAYLQSGWLRRMHLANALTIIAAMATISKVWPMTALGLGVLLIALNLVLAVLEKGWNRLLAIPALLFGVTLILGLPFA